MVLGEEEKAHFAKLLRLYEQVCQVRVVTYCVMANHFHVLVEVPAKPKVMPTEEQLLGPHWPMLRETPPGLRGDRDSPAPSFRR
jgi:REP element-mobilizing transposase RayT